ncbi:MAG: hypothetical protein HY057_03205 [Rhodospirillales bacterium]|nr:hypothetical protein [Rhodospirillales bacterium]
MAETFPPETLNSGFKVDEASCKSRSDAVWIVVDGAGDCIRYYAGNLSGGANEAAVFYLHGDRLWGDKPIAYGDNTSEKQQANVEAFSAEIGLPLIMIARPGVYGSSGSHGNRRQARELRLVNAAIAEIRMRHRIEKAGLTGQSGGGAVAAYVLTQQPDLYCVALTSAALSMKTIIRMDPQSIYDTTRANLYNPIDHVSEVKPDIRRNVFVIGMEGDKFSPLANQKEYADMLKAQKHAVYFFEGEAAGSYRHTLDRTGRSVTSWCLKGASPAEIEKRVQAGEVKG